MEKKENIHEYVDRYITEEGEGHAFNTHKIIVQRANRQVQRYIDKASERLNATREVKGVLYNKRILTALNSNQLEQEEKNLQEASGRNNLKPMEI